MRLNLFPTLLSLEICAGIVSAAYLNDARSLQPRRKTSMLIDPAAQPDLPTITAATAAANAFDLNLSDIQGDILIGMKKKKELFFFFGISNATDFKKKLKSIVLPLVTNTAQLLDVSAQPQTALNIAFSQTGLSALNVTDQLNDSPFSGGQLQDIANLNDPGTTNWVPEFVGTNIHGVILLASDTLASRKYIPFKGQPGQATRRATNASILAAEITHCVNGFVDFGYLDGISNPAVQGFQSPLPGQAVVPAGEILLGEDGDDVSRPAWAKDGSFLVFRQLKQLVPEFNKFLTDNPIRAPALTAQEGSELLGARMIGRWKSVRCEYYDLQTPLTVDFMDRGAPVFLAPLVDDPVLGADPTRNNNFTYGAPGQTTGTSSATDQSKCPFSAHIRKTRPRADLGLPESSSSNHHIVRGGIPYGPEVTADEAASNATEIERGLAFVSYQSNIGNGFQFLQRFWADNTRFIHSGVGFDPIIGANQGAPRVVTGLDLTNVSRPITLTTGKLVL
ncbi:DyP-type peroxidase [Mycena venus]|uniref:DyP-type peroxidase n=1 Tax=Mycena venus TaxID=2733690 RepID=A0A8H6XUQ4_9AGAR|nr:DyP-type peroxidase [Mycena venus]